MRNKKGITLIALVITIIVLLILAAVVITSLSSDDNFILQALGSKKDTTIKSIKEYVLSSYAQVLTNPSLENDPIDELELLIARDNVNKDVKEQFIIKSIDKTTKKIVVEHQGVETEIDLASGSSDGRLDPSPEDDLHKKFTVAFYYKGIDGKDQQTTMYVNENQTLNQYLTASGEFLPKTTDWSPTLEENVPITENKVYREKTENTIFHSVTLNLDGGNIAGSTTIPSILVKNGGVVVVPGSPLKTHYTFTNWTPAITTVILEDTIFTAHWEPVTYTFTFNLNGGNIGGSTANQTTGGVYNTQSFAPAGLVRDNYTFSGWSPELPGTFTGNNTYTAQWTGETRTFIFDLNGGNINGDSEKQIITGPYNSPSIKPANPTREHYRFSGWSPAVPSTFTGNNSYLAQWVPEEYRITYNLAGGTLLGSKLNHIEYIEYNEMPPELKPTKANYVLIGWTPKFVPATADATYTALWSMPMEIGIQAQKFTNVVIPVEIPSESFVLISIDGGGYTQFTSSNPTIVATVTTEEFSIVRIAGRIDTINYGLRTPQERTILTKIFDWGELGATSFSNSFYGCDSLEGPLPSPRPNSFIDVTTFDHTFANCTKLSGSIPTTLFANCPRVTSFRSTFFDCTDLTGSIPSTLFANCPNAKTFIATFYNCSKLTGNAPTLWTGIGEANEGEGCFYNCTKLSNYLIIPPYWKQALSQTD